MREFHIHKCNIKTYKYELFHDYNNNKVSRLFTKILYPHIEILDKNIFLLMKLKEAVITISKKHEGNNIQASKSAIEQAYRIIIAIRKLIISGYEESSRILVRSFIEIYEIALLLSTNREAASDYLDNVHRDSDYFWYHYVSKNKINKSLKALAMEFYKPDNDFEIWIDNLEGCKKDMSMYVHNNMESSLGNIFTPSMIEWGKYNLSNNERYSAHAPGMLLQINYCILFLSNITIDLILNDLLLFDVNMRNYTFLFREFIANTNYICRACEYAENIHQQFLEKWEEKIENC